MKLRLRNQNLIAVATPILLLMVASAQFYLVETHHLTQWKGGGFGMFSTVDSQGARFLRLYLLTPNGRTAVAMPQELQAFAREVRTIPTPDRLQRLADLLAQTTWVPYSYRPGATARLSSPAVAAMPDPDMFPSTPFDDDSAAGATDLQVQQPQAQDDQPVTGRIDLSHSPYRALQRGEPASQEAIVKVYEVQIQLWRFTFDAQNTQVEAHKYLEAHSRP